MTAPIDSFTEYNQAFGFSYVTTANESATTTNVKKIVYAVPLVGIGYIALEHHYYPDNITKAKIARVVLGSSCVGLAPLLLIDLVSSVSSQILFAIHTRKKRKLIKQVYG